MNEKMLQRQIMFKHLQDLHRRQHLQELSKSRNQNYVNQLSSIKEASGGQFSPSVNGTPVPNHSGMFTVGNMQQLPNSGSNGLFLSQSPLGLSQPQLEMSLYGSHTLNLDKNFNEYSHVQGPSNLPVNLMSKNNGSPLGMTTMQPSAFGSSFMSQQYTFSSDQISMLDGSLLSNQEKNLFGQTSVEAFHSGNVSGSYSQQGITTQGNGSSLDSEGRHEDAKWCGPSPSKTSNVGLTIRSEDPDATSLDPLEQKILYNTDDSGWESPFSRIGKMGTARFGNALEHSSHIHALPSLQSGSWSALMQSALEETSGSDPQDEWSGLSFQNSEPSNDNQAPNFIDSKKLQNNWVTGNSPNTVSPSSKPEHVFQNINSFQQSFYQYQQQREGYHSEASHATIQNSPRNNSLLADYNPQPKHSSGGSQLIQTSLPSPNIWLSQHKENLNNEEHQASLLSCSNDNQPHNNFEGHESKRDFWLQGSKSHHLPGVIRKPYDQVNNAHPYSRDPVNMAPRGNVEALPTVLGASLESHSENVAGPSESMLELLNKDVASNDLTPAMQLNPQASTPGTETSVASFTKPCKLSPLPSDFSYRMRPAEAHTPQQHLFFPSSSMGTFSGASLSSHKVNNHVENQYEELPAANEQKYQSSFGCEKNVQEHSGKSSRNGEQLGKGSSPHEGSVELNSSASLSCNIQKQDFFTKYNLEAEGRENEAPSFPATDIGAVSHSLSQNYSLLHKLHSRKNAEIDQCKNFPPKYDSLNYQHSFENDTEKNDLNAVPQLGALWRGDSKGLNFSQEGQGDQSGKALSASCNQSFQQKGMIGQNDILSRPIGGNEASNLAYHSWISSSTAPSWFKHYGTMKNGQMLPTYDPRAAIHAAQPSSEMALGNLQKNSLVMQVNLANASQESSLHLSAAAAPIMYKQLGLPSVLPSDATCQNLANSLPNKRKLAALDVVPWHKEVNLEQPRLQDISSTELSWGQASNRRVEEVKYDAESFEELLPVIRAKRRLLSTTQLVRQVFRPAPSVILCSDASSNCDYIAYYAARLALGDACHLTGYFTSGSRDGSQLPDKLKTSKTTNACKFSEVLGCFIDRVKKLESDITRLEKSISFVDIRVEALELEKFSTINRFAKFHVKALSSTADTASSSATTIQKPHAQRYVVGHPMPKIVPEGIDCLSL